MTVKVKIEDLNPGSPLNKLFNDFFKLNKIILSVPTTFRDNEFQEYVSKLISGFCKIYDTPYGISLADNFKSMLEENPNETKLFETESLEFHFFQKFWKLHHLYINGDEMQTRSNAYWERVIKDTQQLSHEYKTAMESSYVVNILLSFIEELERRDKEERREAFDS